MRFLLLIPVFILLLSNVPFIQEMPMEEMMAMMEKQEKKDCCKKDMEAEAKSCHAESESEPGATSCHSASAPEAKPCRAEPEPAPAPMACHPGTMPVENSCQPSGANCVCICVFQFAAPAQDLKSFQFIPVNILAGRTGYLELKWKDPHIASPGQPPDWA